MDRREVVTFLSDYGLEDEFVGVCHGVMLSIAPQIKVVDVHHNILRQSIRHGAIVLEQACRYLPAAVNLAVVDPAVGLERKSIAVVTGADQIFVGPDNGLLVPAAEACGGITAAYEIVEEKYMLTPISNTFHGRDVFAPAAAHLANGVDPSELGPVVDAGALARLEMPHAWVHDDHVHAEVLQVDRFGNLQFNLKKDVLENAGLGRGRVLEIRVEGHRLHVPFAETFGDVDAGDFVLVEDSYSYLSLAINKGDARARLRARAGSTAIVGPGSS